MSNQEIYVRIKDVYGAKNIYPVCDKAHLFANIAATKTLTQHTIEHIKKLGYTIKVEQEVVTL